MKGNIRSFGFLGFVCSVLKTYFLREEFFTRDILKNNFENVFLKGAMFKDIFFFEMYLLREQFFKKNTLKCIF